MERHLVVTRAVRRNRSKKLSPTRFKIGQQVRVVWPYTPDHGFVGTVQGRQEGEIIVFLRHASRAVRYPHTVLERITE